VPHEFHPVAKPKRTGKFYQLIGERLSVVVLLANYHELHIGPSLPNTARSSYEFFLPFFFGYLADAGNNKASSQTEQPSRGVSVNLLKALGINPVRYRVNTLRRKLNARYDRFAHAVADSDDSRHAVKHPPVERISFERQVVMSSQHKLCAPRVSTRKRSDQIVAAYVRVNDVDVVLVDQVCDGPCGLKIERVPERHFVPRCDYARKPSPQRAVGSHGKIDCVTSIGKPAHEICDMHFPAAHLACRANL
jgi:hypothetical protein